MSSTPQNFEEAKRAFLAGIAHYEAGRFPEARSSFEEALLLVPGRVSTLGNLAATLLKLGEPEAALPLLEQAIAADASYLDAWLHRAEALAALGRQDDALASLDSALALKPDSVPALYERSVLLNSMGRHAESLAASARLVAREPQNTDGWAIRAEALHRLERLEDALRAFDTLLEIDPKLHRAWSQRAAILKDLGYREDAAASFRQAIALGGDAALNGYFLASLTGEGAPATAPSGYVEALFDDYAGLFDTHLVNVLGYKAHSVLIGHAQAVGKKHYRAALDLGCGTGLCGPLVKAFADRVDGVDLSSKMITRAGELGVYGSLVQADIASFLQGTDQRYDMVLSADVFIYVGALEAVFAGVQRVLEPGGLFCFSVERVKQDDRAGAGIEYQLMSSQRYAHSPDYLRTLASSYGFRVADVLEQPIREEQGRPIDGLYVYLLRE
ncbi:MAG: tetratricopeptide repeat protein [Pseudomonadota bacterium]